MAEGEGSTYKDEDYVYEYYCDDCEDEFFLKTFRVPSELCCPHCGSKEEVSISSEHLDKFLEEEYE